MKKRFLHVLTGLKVGLCCWVSARAHHFFWSGRHWVRAAVLYLLNSAEGMLYDCGPSWLDTAWLLLMRGCQLGYDKQLFLLDQGGDEIMDLDPFYSLLLQA